MLAYDRDDRAERFREAERQRIREAQALRKRFFVGLDLGRVADYTAIAVAEKHQIARNPATYDLAHYERMRDVSYVDIVTYVAKLLWELNQAFKQQYADPVIELVIDGTGVGVAVVDLFRRASLPGRMVAITITGGDSVTQDGDTYRVPKRDLAGVVQVLLQSRRLRYARDLPLTAVLQGELLNFKAKISLSGHDSYGAGSDWRDSNHDDLVLAAALALWRGEREQSSVIVSDYFGNPIVDVDEGWDR